MLECGTQNSQIRDSWFLGTEPTFSSRISLMPSSEEELSTLASLQQLLF